VSDERPSEMLRRLADGYQVTQAIHVAATLAIADELGAAEKTSDELAAATGSDPETLYRLLRALASVGVLEERSERRFALTPVGECLRRDAPESLAGWAAYVGLPDHWQAWGALLHSVQTGENAFPHVHGANVWEYRVQHPEVSAVFDRAMQDVTRLANDALLDAYDFGRFATVIDIGGGNGTLLAGLLQRYPSMQGALFDQPHVVARADEVFRRAGVADRARIVAGNFFEEVPEGGDAYLLKAIIHDWEDQESASILRNCRHAIADADGVVLLVERELGPPNEEPGAKFSDLNMLVAPGGRERTIDEYRQLLASAGFRLDRVTPTARGLNIIEGSPDQP
jgi:O-methyltransferase domain/Dimerisation domain